MLELALIGAGTMGTNHARVMMSLRDARLAVVIDPDEATGRRVAEQAGARWAQDHRQVAGMVDAAVVAVPTNHHRRVVEDCLDAGIHVLVEKPIASTIADAEAMVAASEASGLVFAVGHVERFNPAILELDALVAEPLHVAVQRISPYTPRIPDGVTADLMIHDLDLVASLANSEPISVQAISQDVYGSDDICTAAIHFQNGLVASLTASRVGQDKVRRMSITQRNEYIRADLIQQSITLHRVGRIEDSGLGGFRQSGIVEVPFLSHRGEPLLLQVGHFVDCILNGQLPRIPGRDGVRALRLVDAVVRASRRSQETES